MAFLARAHRHWVVLLCGGLGLIYGPLVRFDPVLERDDRQMLFFLKTWDQVVLLVREGRWQELIAFQLVKDASLWLDRWLSGALGFGTFHATNLVIWAACVALGLRLLERDRKGRAGSAAARWCILLFAFHPLFVGSVGWISARKHLLSFLFVLLATWELAGAARPRAWRATLWYLLSLMCHPIHVLWPLWALARAKLVEPRRSERGRTLARAAILSALPLAAAAAANFAYYTGQYVTHTGVTKLVSPENGVFAVSLLALGRYAANLLVPVRLASAYDPASWLGLVGLVALPVLGVLARRLPSARLAASWAVFAALPLAVVTARMTHVFVSDTYALAAGFGLAAALLATWEDLAPRGRLVPAALSLVLAGSVLVSIEIAGSWRSDAALWERAARLEATPRSLSLHARFLLEQGRHLEASQTIARLAGMSPRDPALAYLGARLAASDPARTRLERIRALEGELSTPRDPAVSGWAAYFLSGLYAESGSFDLAYRAAGRSLASPGVFSQDLPVVVAESQYFCERARRAGCESAAEPFRARPGGIYWDDRPYWKRLEELRGTSS